MKLILVIILCDLLGTIPRIDQQVMKSLEKSWILKLYFSCRERFGKIMKYRKSLGNVITFFYNDPNHNNSS